MLQRKNPWVRKQKPPVPYREQMRKSRELKKKRAENKKKRIESGFGVVSNTEWKLFCDEIFQTYIRIRDNWTDVLSGRKYEIGSFKYYQACHFIKRDRMWTRYEERNCHGGSSMDNFKEFIKDPETIRKYTLFMQHKYGPNIVEELENMSMNEQKWTAADYIRVGKEFHAKILSFSGGLDVLNDRLTYKYPTILKKVVLGRIMAIITADE